jgi:hypothetical protein
MFLQYGSTSLLLSRAACGLTINGIFSLSLHAVTFLPEGVIVGLQNFAWGFISQKE